MIKEYLKLSKPGIIFGNLVTCLAGYFLGARNSFSILGLLALVTGLSLVIASSCIFNNYHDRFIDEKMERTKKRAFVINKVNPKQALAIAGALLFLGTLSLNHFASSLSALFALLGFIFYVFVYTPMKPRSSHATAIGSIAGAIPPLVGYLAVCPRLDKIALTLFLMIAFWQMPHFYAIAMYRKAEYATAGIPVLPVLKGNSSTKIQMNIYTAAFLLVSFLPYILNFKGITYLITSSVLSLAWMLIALRGFNAGCDIKWAKMMFRFSLVVVMLMSLALSL